MRLAPTRSVRIRSILILTFDARAAEARPGLLQGVSMTTRFRSMSVGAAALVVGLSLGTTGCGKYSLGSEKAQKSMKDANVQYAAQDWKKAADLYEDVLT